MPGAKTRQRLLPYHILISDNQELITIPREQKIFDRMRSRSLPQ